MPRTTSRASATPLRRSPRLHPNAVPTTTVSQKRRAPCQYTRLDSDDDDDQQTLRQNHTTTRRVVATRRRTTVTLIPDTASSVGSATSERGCDQALDLAARLAANAQENEVAWAQERRVARRCLRETLDATARQTELITETFREAMEANKQQTQLVMTTLNELLHATAGKRVEPRDQEK